MLFVLSIIIIIEYLLMRRMVQHIGPLPVECVILIISESKEESKAIKRESKRFNDIPSQPIHMEYHVVE